MKFKSNVFYKKLAKLKETKGSNGKKKDTEGLDFKEPKKPFLQKTKNMQIFLIFGMKIIKYDPKLRNSIFMKLRKVEVVPYKKMCVSSK